MQEPQGKKKKIDKFFLTVSIILIILGISMFVSASLGILPKSEKIFYSVIISQLVLGLTFGAIGMYATFKIPYSFWKRYSLYLFIGAILLTAAVFIPHVGITRQGAERWIGVGPVSFQPAEILKFAFVIYFASWLAWAKNRVQDFRFGILPLSILLVIIAGILLRQPDTKSFILISVTGLLMLFISGVPLRYIFGLGLGAIILLGTLVFFTPYLQARVKTFINPSADSQGASYQIQQSLIALGSGGVFGRGFGQSIQKFSYLPEPQGDSIFAVLGEELGIVGTVGTIILYLLFSLRGLRIANNSPDLFSRLLVSGIVILITAQTFMHIASVIGVFPLTGVPLPFMSHGGTSLMIDLMAVGIILQVSKYQTRSS
ncbi:putative lipid II flippase FtsW [Patescibacteria group bacterium]|nr:putative lipid II flippase FtsW [Patescibacteria group bacterium]